MNDQDLRELYETANGGNTSSPVRADLDTIREALRSGRGGDPFVLAALDRLAGCVEAAEARAAAYEQVAKAADAIVLFLDANEVVPQCERTALINALLDVGLGAREALAAAEETKT